MKKLVIINLEESAYKELAVRGDVILIRDPKNRSDLDQQLEEYHGQYDEVFFNFNSSMVASTPNIKITDSSMKVSEISELIENERFDWQLEKDPQGLLFKIIDDGDVGKLRLAIAGNIDLNLRNGFQNTPLTHAVQKTYPNSVKIVELLIDGGANVALTGAYDLTVLQMSVGAGNIEATELLLLNPEIDLGFDDGLIQEVLFQANRDGKNDVIKALNIVQELSKKVDNHNNMTENPTIDGVPPYYDEFLNSVQPTTFATPSPYRKDQKELDKEYIEAVADGNINGVEEAIGQGANIDAKANLSGMDKHHGAMHVAILSLNIDMVECLKSHGMEVRLTSFYQGPQAFAASARAEAMNVDFGRQLGKIELEETRKAKESLSVGDIESYIFPEDERSKNCWPTSNDEKIYYSFQAPDNLMNFEHQSNKMTYRGQNGSPFFSEGKHKNQDLSFAEQELTRNTIQREFGKTLVDVEEVVLTREELRDMDSGKGDKNVIFIIKGVADLKEQYDKSRAVHYASIQTFNMEDDKTTKYKAILLPHNEFETPSHLVHMLGHASACLNDANRPNNKNPGIFDETVKFTRHIDKGQTAMADNGYQEMECWVNTGVKEARKARASGKGEKCEDTNYYGFTESDVAAINRQWGKDLPALDLDVKVEQKHIDFFKKFALNSGVKPSQDQNPSQIGGTKGSDNLTLGQGSSLTGTTTGDLILGTTAVAAVATAAAVVAAKFMGRGGTKKPSGEKLEDLDKTKDTGR